MPDWSNMPKKIKKGKEKAKKARKRGGYTNYKVLLNGKTSIKVDGISSAREAVRDIAERAKEGSSIVIRYSNSEVYGTVRGYQEPNIENYIVVDSSPTLVWSKSRGDIE